MPLFHSPRQTDTYSLSLHNRGGGEEEGNKLIINIHAAKKYFTIYTLNISINLIKTFSFSFSFNLYSSTHYPLSAAIIFYPPKKSPITHHSPPLPTLSHLLPNKNFFLFLCFCFHPSSNGAYVRQLRRHLAITRLTQISTGAIPHKNLPAGWWSLHRPCSFLGRRRHHLRRLASPWVRTWSSSQLLQAQQLF